MRFHTILLAALASLAIATPLPSDVDVSLERRQSMSSNDLEKGDCKSVAFIFARGSTEMGNMVTSAFPRIGKLFRQTTNLQRASSSAPVSVAI
jgi:cutinase